MSKIQIRSEIGRLRKVMLHRPGKEIENLIPDYLERLLFDDIPYLKVAIKEHDRFAELLRQNGAEVLYLTEMLAHVFKDDAVREAFVAELLSECPMNSKTRKAAIKEYLLSMAPPEMINSVMSGIRKAEVHFTSSSLSDIMKSDYEFYIDPMPNLYFTRDPGACIGGGLSINTMKTSARQRETLFLKYLHAHHPDFAGTPLWYNRDFPNYIEGGDILVLSSKVVAVGCSERTSASAIEKMARKLFAGDQGFERVLVIEIQKRRAYMHLDTVFTMVDRDKFTIHPGIESDIVLYEVVKTSDGAESHVLTGTLQQELERALELDHVELIKCGGGDEIVSGREQWNDGSNTLAIAPGLVITYERNYVSNEHLEKHGIKVLSMPSSELSRGRGGPRCMSMPIYRDEI